MLALFLVETKDRKHDSDLMYIRALIGHRYSIGKTKLDQVYLNGKSNFNRVEEKVYRKINSYKNAPQSDRKIAVFLCVDTDSINRGDSMQENIARNQEIVRYCKDRGWNLIWFCEDIEEVFIGHKVSSKDKVKTAASFYSKGSIVHYDESKMSAERYDQLRPGISNITTVLDEFFQKI